MPEEILPQELLMEGETEAWQCLWVHLPFQFVLCIFCAVLERVTVLRQQMNSLWFPPAIYCWLIKTVNSEHPLVVLHEDKSCSNLNNGT